MKIDEQTKKVLAAYSGPVRRCPAGEARAEPVKIVGKRDDASRWLRQHRDDEPVRDAKVEHRRMKMERTQRLRIAERNAMIRRMIK